MTKFSLDYQNLSKSVAKVDNKVYKLSDVKDKIEKVAFDIVRFKDADPEELWQIQNADDGDYIVARYNDDTVETKVATASSNPWDVMVNNASLNIFYKGDPIINIASSKLGFAADKLSDVKRFLPKSLNSDKNLVKALMMELNATAKQNILQKYPELSL